jgi:hypothetical protein
MKLNPVAVAEAMRTYGAVKQLIDALRSDSIGQDARWDLLQTFLKENPVWKIRIKQSLKLSPSDALDFLITEMGFDPKTLATLFDRDGQLRPKLESGIGIIQELYRERMKES